MKKLFNYALLAAALLVGVNVNADEVTIDGEQAYGDLKAAIEQAEGERTIIVEKDLTGSDKIAIENGQSIILKLGTHKIFCANKYFFCIGHGSLTVEGEEGSKIENTLGGTGSTESYCVCLTGSANDVPDYSVFTLGENVNLINNGFYLVGVNNKDWNGVTNNAKNKPYGIVVNIKGYAEGKYGFSINGGYTNKEGNVLVFNISGTLKVPTDCAIYAAGYAIWNITGEVTGATGIYIKSGELNLDGATITATGNYADPKPNGSGCDGTGAAVVIDTHENYAGGIVVNVEGNTNISSANGYGIQEVITKGDEGVSHCEGINIESGSISGADGKAAISTTEVGTSVVTIEGGTFNSDVAIYLAGKTDGIINPSTDENGNTIYVVSTKPEGKDWKNDITHAQAGDYVKLGQDADQTIGSGSTSPSIEAAYLVAEKNAKVTIPTGKTLTVGEIVMSKDAQIVVEKGAYLIVEGYKGIVANQASNIVLKSEENAPAFFLLDPQVQSNMTPKATINFTSKAWRTNADEKEYQYFGAPTVGGSIDKIVANPATYKTQLDAWNGAGWSRVGIMDGNDDSELDYGVFNRAFGFYSILSTNPKGVENRITYTFSGNLYGNSNPEVAVEHGWAPMSNGFTGTMDGTAILNVLEGTGVDEVVYTPSQTISGHIQWIGHTGIRYLEKVKPMDVFMLRNNANKNDVTLNYKDLVWTPATTTSTKAPRANRYAMATIRVNGSDLDDIVTIAEDNNFSADFDNGFDAEKYNNEDICFFVNADKKYDIFATDNLDNTFVGLMTTKAGKYTISFEDVTGNFALIDNKTNARIAMAEGTTYEFMAEAGEDAYRFTIVAGAQAPTEMQKTNAAVKATRALINGQIVISNGERFFNVLGTEVK